MEYRLKELEKKANKHSGQGAVLTDNQERVAALEGMLQDTVEALHSPSRNQGEGQTHSTSQEGAAGSQEEAVRPIYRFMYIGLLYVTKNMKY